jgi:hypothetical protein
MARCDRLPPGKPRILTGSRRLDLPCCRWNIVFDGEIRIPVLTLHTKGDGGLAFRLLHI